ncbi:DsbA family oxidoreductase [Algihabitans albus]|uniref:DsbA family oxidoreductase n=1 Tax=Algihabitans albus TaxID=2164067 RepID=UPI000E5D673A|nr:DsbA family oxidoreductase [Algihabitans albus]
MELDIFSDVICPWCFIGKRRLEAAFAERPQPGLVVRWRAFQLNPDMPAEGMGRQAYLEQKFGGAENAQRLYNQIGTVGAEVGIDFAFDKIRRTPNTVNAHRLIRLAARLDREEAVVERLFRAYFLEGSDIGDTALLVELAAEAGIDAQEAARFLASDEERSAVESEDLGGRQAGITGVPTFIVNRRHAVPGAQPPEVLHKLFDLGREGAQAAEA